MGVVEPALELQLCGLPVYWAVALDGVGVESGWAGSYEQFAAGLGVDAIGLVFAKSPRRIEADIARRISLSLPPFVSTVGVFVDADLDLVRHDSYNCFLHDEYHH